MKIEAIQQKINSIELLRIIATLFILIFHAYFMQDAQYQKFFYWRRGAIFVEYFFIISGFFLPNVLIENVNFKKFILLRIFRLFPVAFVLTVSMSIFYFNIPLFTIITDMFLLTSVGFAERQAICGYCWYLYVLIWVSCFYYCILFFVKNKMQLNFILGLLVYVSLLILTNKLPLSFDHQHNIFKIFNSGVLRGVACVGLGIILRVNFYFPHQRMKYKQKIILSFVELTVIGYLFYQLAFVKLSETIDFVVPFLILFSVIHILLVNNLGYISEILNKVNVSNISKYCLSTYVLQTIPRIFLPINENLNGNALVFIYCLFSIILGILGYHIIEKPCVSYIHRYLRRE